MDKNLIIAIVVICMLVVIMVSFNIYYNTSKSGLQKTITKLDAELKARPASTTCPITSAELDQLKTTNLTALTKCQADFNNLKASQISGSCDAIQSAKNKCDAQLGSLQNDYGALNSKYSALESGYKSLQTTVNNTQVSNTKCNTELSGLKTSYNTLKSDYDTVKAQCGNSTTACQSLKDAKDKCDFDYGELNTQYTALQSGYTAMQGNYNRAKTAGDKCTVEFGSLKNTLATLQGNYDTLKTQCNNAVDCSAVQSAKDKCDNDYSDLTAKYDALNVNNKNNILSLNNCKTELSTTTAKYTLLSNETILNGNTYMAYNIGANPNTKTILSTNPGTGALSMVPYSEQDINRFAFVFCPYASDKAYYIINKATGHMLFNTGTTLGMKSAVGVNLFNTTPDNPEDKASVQSFMWLLVYKRQLTKDNVVYTQYYLYSVLTGYVLTVNKSGAVSILTVDPRSSPSENHYWTFINGSPSVGIRLM